MMGWVGRVAHIGECEGITYFWLVNMKGRDDLVHAGFDTGEEFGW